MRIPFLLPTVGFWFLAAIVPTKTCLAQRPTPVGVIGHSANGRNTAVREALRLKEPRRWQQRSFWNWTGLGMLVGAVAGGIWAGVQIAHSDDPMLANEGIAIGVGGGAII